MPGHFIPTPAGTRYGRLVVLEDRPRGRGVATVLCRCDCGTELRRDTTELRRGRVQSCGCLRRDTARAMHHLPPRDPDQGSGPLARAWTPYETEEL